MKATSGLGCKSGIPDAKRCDTLLGYLRNSKRVGGSEPSRKLYYALRVSGKYVQGDKRAWKAILQAQTQRVLMNIEGVADTLPAGVFRSSWTQSASMFDGWSSCAPMWATNGGVPIGRWRRYGDTLMNVFG